MCDSRVQAEEWADDMDMLVGDEDEFTFSYNVVSPGQSSPLPLNVHCLMLSFCFVANFGPRMSVHHHR